MRTRTSTANHGRYVTAAVPAGLLAAVLPGAASVSRITGILIGLVLLSAPTATGQAYMTEEGYAEFFSEAPVESFTGESQHLTGMIDLEDGTVDFYLDLNTLETGISRRDRDMRETYLQTDQYPFAEFYGELSGDFDPEAAGPQQVTATGEFTLHGVTREVSIDGRLQHSGNSLELEASWIINITDYDIEVPSLFVFRVAEEQEVTIQAELEPVERD